MPGVLRAGTPLGQRGPLRVLGRGIDALTAAAFAPACAACGTPLEAPSRGCVCAACWAAAIQAPPPPWTDPSITIGAAAGRYEGSLRAIIHAFKYEGRRSLARPLGRLMRAACADVLTGADCVIPVPLHPWRRLTRGFNQAIDLAHQLDCPVVHALWRRRSTASQMTLPARSRRSNVQEAFILSPWLSARHRGTALDRSPIDDRIVVLVDDVRTTGATLNACARVLKARGVREVRAMTVVIADRWT